MRLLVVAAVWHLGDRLANMAEGLHPLFSSRRSDRAIRDLDKFPPSGTRTSALPSPSLASSRRSEAEVLSRATLIGDGQTGVCARKGREGEAVREGGSGIPV